MGLDLPELTARLNRQFDIAIDPAEWDALLASLPAVDLTVEQVYRLVEQRRGNADPPPLVVEGRGPGAAGGNVVWLEVRKVFAAVMQMPLRQIKPGSLLRRDLGVVW